MLALGLATLLSSSAFNVGGTSMLRAVRSAPSYFMQVSAPAPEKVDSALKSIKLTNAAGDSAEVYTFGACVTSYVKDGVDTLMVRPDAKMDGSKPISGGIPHCFPQFGPGAIQQHGFARNLDWEVAEQEANKLVLKLTESEYTLSMWDFPFEAKYTVTLADDRLSTELTVTNTGGATCDSCAPPSHHPLAPRLLSSLGLTPPILPCRFDFTAALHSYWSISGVGNIKIESPAFKGASYLDKMQDPPASVKCDSPAITIAKETDSVFADVRARATRGAHGAPRAHRARRARSVRPVAPPLSSPVAVRARVGSTGLRRRDARGLEAQAAAHDLLISRLERHGRLEPVRQRGHGLRLLRVRRGRPGDV